MTHLELHPLPGSKRAAALAEVVEELYRAGRRVVVWVGDEGRRQVLDEYLWTFRKLSFVPHGVWPAPDAEADPVLLLGEAVNPNRADVLVVGDGLPPPEFAGTFGEVHDFVEAGPAGEERAAWWREQLPPS